MENVLDEIRSAFPGKENTKSLEKMLFKTKKFYYQIQYQKQKLEILKEVKGHFEKAVNKIEEKYDEGEEDISQWDSILIEVNLKIGQGSFECYTCDFTNDYINLNTDYRN